MSGGSLITDRSHPWMGLSGPAHLCLQKALEVPLSSASSMLSDSAGVCALLRCGQATCCIGTRGFGWGAETGRKTDDRGREIGTAGWCTKPRSASPTRIDVALRSRRTLALAFKAPSSLWCTGWGCSRSARPSNNEEDEKEFCTHLVPDSRYGVEGDERIPRAARRLMHSGLRDAVRVFPAGGSLVRIEERESSRGGAALALIYVLATAGCVLAGSMSIRWRAQLLDDALPTSLAEDAEEPVMLARASPIPRREGVDVTCERRESGEQASGGVTSSKAADDTRGPRAGVFLFGSAPQRPSTSETNILLPL
ncbi:hypothetical protein DFH09DRAFT_1361041, partial [Mycena vulgaris]